MSSNCINEQILEITNKKEKNEDVIERLKQLKDSEEENGEAIHILVSEISFLTYRYDIHKKKIISISDNHQSFTLNEYILFYQTEIEKLQDVLEALQTPMPSKDQQTIYYYKLIFSQVNETVEKLFPILNNRLEFLKTRLTSDISDKLQEIISILKITKKELISNLEYIFREKYAKEVSSNRGLAIILALSNISKYDDPNDLSLSLDDEWLFSEILDKYIDDNYFKQFAIVFLKAFGNPFVLDTFPNDPIWNNQLLVKSTPYIIKCHKEELSEFLNIINCFLKRFHKYDGIIYLTFDDDSRGSLSISRALSSLHNLSSMLQLEEHESASESASL